MSRKGTPSEVLHISNGYLGLSNVHKCLYGELDNQGIGQVIFAPVRKGKMPRQDRELKFKEARSELVFSRTLKLRHKLFFREKIHYLYKDLRRQIDVNAVWLAHATTLYSDGAIALKLHQQYGIPYIVTVRSTDLAFVRYRPDLSSLAKNILLNASKIVFVSKSMLYELFSLRYFKSAKESLRIKSIVLNNGIDSIWLSNIYPKRQLASIPYKILYVGRFTKPKNILRLIQSIKLLNLRNIKVILTIVGDKGYLKPEVIKLAEKNSSFINYSGPIYDKGQLIDLFREHHIFAMPSFRETFGQVYIEALSQGLPVLYGRKEGIDGLFEENIGEAVNPFSVKDITKGLEQIVNNYDRYNLQEISFQKFHWGYLANKYIEIYNSIETLTSDKIK